MEALTLSSQQVIAAVAALEGVRLPTSTLAFWAKAGIAPPSVRWTHEAGQNGRLYNVADLARVRLVVRLRRKGISMPKVRNMLVYLDAQFRELFRRGTNARLIIAGARAYLVRPGESDIDIPSGQLTLKLDQMFVGIERAAHNAQRAA